jgi:HEAT repeat protein
MNSAQYCRCIAIAGHTGDAETVIAALADARAEVRVSAIGAAARLDLLEAADLRRFLADPSTDVRYRALEVLPAVGDGSAVADIVVGLLDDPELAEMAAFALGELPLVDPLRSNAVTALGRQATGHDDPLCRESAVAALGALGQGLHYILEATGDVATVRRRAVLALAPFDGPKVDATLQRALQDRDWQVRQAAEDLLSP